MFTLVFTDGSTHTDYYDLDEGGKLLNSLRTHRIEVGSKIRFYGEVSEIRQPTPDEEATFYRSASEAEEEVEAREFHRSTKSLPKHWSIGHDGRTYNQFGEVA